MAWQRGTGRAGGPYRSRPRRSFDADRDDYSMNGFEVLRRALEANNAIAGDVAALRASVCVIVAGADETSGVCLISRTEWAAVPRSTHIYIHGGSRMCLDHQE